MGLFKAYSCRQPDWKQFINIHEATWLPALYRICSAPISGGVQRFQRHSILKCSYFENELSRKTKKVITRGRMRYFEVTEIQLIPHDRLQKKAVLKMFA